MKLRITILVLLLAIPLLLLVVNRSERARNREARQARVPGVSDVETAPPLPRAFRPDSIPGPDARLLLAAADLRQIIAGVPGLVSAQRMDTGWRIVARTDGAHVSPIGVVPDGEGFEGIARALAIHARLLLAEHPGVDTIAPDAIGADAAASAYHLACVALAVPDPMGLADPLHARALAALALAEASGGATLHRARAVLAEAMGYREAAAREAALLDRDDPTRICLLGPAAVLAASARAPGATVETRMLWLHRLAEVDPRAWESAADGTDPVLAATGLAIGLRADGRAAPGHARAVPSDETLRRDANRAIAAVFEALPQGEDRESEIRTATPSALADRFERALLAVPDDSADPFGDHAIARALYPPIFYAALERIAGTAGHTPSILDGLGPAAPDPYAAAGRPAAFSTWCWMRAAAEADFNDPTKVQLRIRLLRWFGPPALLALRDALRARLPEGHPVLRGIEHELRLRRDGRPADGAARYLEAAGLAPPS